MQDISSNSQEMPAAPAARRGVSADSFRKLTALLKKPAAALLPADAPRPDLKPVLLQPIPQMVPPVEVVDYDEPVAAAPAEAPITRGPEALVETAAETTSAEPEAIAATSVLTTPVVAEPAEGLVQQPVQPSEKVTEQAAEQVVEPAPNSVYLRKKKKQQDAFSEVIAADVRPMSKAQPQLTPEQEAEKADLARSLLDMMASSASTGQPQERALAADTLLRMLPQLPAAMRTTLAQRLSIMDAPPPFLVARLIADPDIAVSGPLLEQCMHMADEDLFAVIKAGRPDQQRMVARRRRINRPIADELAKSQDPSVLLTLVRNRGAEISSEGFGMLEVAAAEMPDLLAPLCTRQDLPVHIAFSLFWSAPAQLRRYLLSRFLTDSETLTKILKITMYNGDEERPHLGIEEVGAALLQLLEGEREQPMATLAKGAHISIAAVERILEDDQGEPLMALLKVAGVPRSQLEANMKRLVEASHPLIDPMRNLDELQAVFDQLSFNKARILLTYWDWAATHSGPYAVHH